VLNIPVERRTLANGLRVVLSVDDSAPVVAVNLWYGVGSRNEPPGLTGFAHLFEHMMFQGSEHVPKGGHFDLIERAGGSLNATTWFDRTNYYETLPSHQLDLALWLESDRMGWMLPAMTEEKLRNQREVVKNEKRQRYDNQPYGDWDERLQRLVYPTDHPYHHPVIGSMDDLDAATLDDVASFFRTFYVPNNAVLTVCGDFDPRRALDSIERWFGEIPPRGPLPPLPGTSEVPARIGRTVREHVVTEVPLPRALAAYRVPPFSDPDFYVADVATSVLGTGRSSRLYRALVRERRLAKDVVTYAFPLVTGAAMMLSWATGYPHVTLAALEEALLEEVQGLVDVTDDEVERAVALAETHILEMVERVGTRADLLSMFETYFGDPARLNTELERIREVTPDRLRAFARDFLGEDNRAVLLYEPAPDAPVPASAEDAGEEAQ
jgi:predicted Zn-dependent peptidase